MADADEDLIPRSHPSSFSATADPSADLEDEAQDFRFLANLTSSGSRSAGSGALPKRGEKDFEPNPTQAQSNTLAASREAMHNALSVERVLIPRNPVVGQFLPDQKDWRWDVIPEYDVDGCKMKKGRGGRCVVVEKFRTTYAKSIGVADYRNWTWLLPEEALFLIERGTLDIRWPDEGVQKFMKGGPGRGGEDEVDGGDGDDSTLKEDEDEYDHGSDEEVEIISDAEVLTKNEDGSTKKKHPHQMPLHVGEVPMSLQGAYASFIGKSGLTLEHYNVYAGLRRLGYIVLRAPTWDEGSDNEDGEDDSHTNGHASEPNGHPTEPLLPATSQTISSISKPSGATSLINRLVSFLFTPKPLHYRPIQGPLIYPGLYRNYNDIFRTLSLISYHQPSKQRSTPTPKPPFSISFYAFKPNTQFRKSAPPPPDFRIAVLDARTTGVPTVQELGTLLDSVPGDELPKEKRMEQRLKHGTRNVILAVVDCGLVSYLRVADMCSGVNGRVYEVKTGGGGKGKRGGGWGKRGGGGRGGKR